MIKQTQSFVAASLLALSSNFMPVALRFLIGVPAVTLFSQAAKAEIVPFILRKALGCSITCEAIVVSQKTGNIFKVEYYDRVGANEGAEIAIELDDYDNWVRIINPVNGNSSNVRSVQKMN